MRELAASEADDIHVLLLRPARQDAVTGTVDDERGNQRLGRAVARDRAREAVYDPVAHAAAYSDAAL
jgi:hypothetical protein